VIKNLFKKKSGNFVGLELKSGELFGVAVKWNDGVPSLIQMDQIVEEGGAEKKSLLKAWVDKNQLANSRCSVVLGQGSYQLILVEPPEVENEEMRSAIKWRLKDLLSFPVEDAAIDIFYMPADGSRSKKKMVYVVATENKQVEEVINMVSEANLNLEYIDVTEMAIRNLVQRLLCDDNSERGVAVAKLGARNGSVYIYRQGNLYMARNFSLAYNGGLLDELPQDVLALELQRSLDYYERQMGQAPPSVIYLCGENVSEDKIGEGLRSNFSIPLQLADPSAFIWTEKGIDVMAMQHGIAAFGGILRFEGNA